MGIIQIVAEVVAIVASPLIALWVTERARKSTERTQRKHWIFRTLVATRGARLDPGHVAALNMVALDFAEDTESSRAVVAACKAYFHELNQAQGGDAQRAIDLLDQLLYQVSRALGFRFDHADMKSRWYSPNWFLYTAEHQARIHDLVRALHEHNGVIPVAVVDGPAAQPQPTVSLGLGAGTVTAVRLGPADARAAE